jgi:glycosyltransferase involved in cell wall biosynthesis
MTSIKLSVVIITKNEEKNIVRCLESLAGVADEVIVLDSYSTDNTVALVHQSGYTLVQREWEGFSASKNYANNLATGDYILSIDADEVLSDKLKQSILTFKRERDVDACEINRLTNYCGQWIRHSGWYPEYKLRIFKRDAARWKGSIHEELEFSSPPQKIKKLEGDLLHYSYPTVESHLKKMFPYASLAAERDFQKGKKYFFITHAVLKPMWMFIKKYILNLGFLDGLYGFVIAVLSSFDRFLRYLKYREMKTHARSHANPNSKA